MRLKARKLFPVGLSFWLALAGVSAVMLWRYAYPNLSHSLSPGAASQADDPARRVMPEAVAALKAEIEHLQADKERRAGETKNELQALRSQLTRVDRNQEALSREINQIGEASRTSVGGEGADMPPLTPEQEDTRTQAQVQAQLTLLDSARRAEQPDPQWASTAQLALHEALQSKAVTGLQVREMDCRTTLCTAELLLDASASPEAIFRDLVHLAPWQGQGFVHFDEGGSAVVYLAREGYSLPQASE